MWGFDGPNLPTCAFRFGHALSAIRSQHYDRNVRKAVKFLKAAKKTTNQFNETARMNSLWTNSADLKPIISYLSSHRQWRCNEWKIYLCELACSSARPRFARGVVCGGFSDLLQDVAQKRGGPMLTIWSHQRPISPITNYDEYVEFVQTTTRFDWWTIDFIKPQTVNQLLYNPLSLTHTPPCSPATAAKEPDGALGGKAIPQESCRCHRDP